MATDKDIASVKATIARIEDEVRTKSDELAVMVSARQAQDGKIMLKSMEIGACSAQLDYCERCLAEWEGRPPVENQHIELSIFGNKASGKA